MSPNAFKRQEDGDLILVMMHEAQTNPIERPFDPRKLARKPYYVTVDLPKGKNKKAIQTVISVPDVDTEAEVVAAPVETPEARTRHTEIQDRLLELGIALGLDVWVARNDRSKSYNGQLLGGMPKMLDELPDQFNEATTRTIELIDVLWLKNNSIIAAFEVEATTSVYSGLLRMSDLLSLQPNLDIPLYLVAPDERRSKVKQEIRRPTFSYREKPLPKICGFLPFDKLMQTIDGISQLGLAASLRPEFLRTTAEYFDSVQETE
jgi:hypothetical protein